MAQRMTRRDLLVRSGLLIGGGALMGLLAACGGGQPAQAPAAKPTEAPQPGAPAAATSAPAASGPAVKGGEPTVLKVTGWGGGWETLMKDTVYPMFEQQYNVKIETDTAFPFPPKLLASPKDKPIYDVLHSNTNEVQKAYDAGFLEKQSAYTTANIPNLADAYDYAKAESLPGIAAFTSAIGIGFRTDKGLKPISSWNDLWDQSLGGEKAAYVITNNLAMTLLMLAGKLFGSGYQDLDAAFKAMEQLKPVKLVDFTGTMEKVLLSGEVKVGVIHDSGVYRHANDDPVPPLDWVAPSEGTPALEQVFSVTSGSSKKELAFAYINHFLSEPVQKAVGEGVWYGLANKKVQLSGKFAGKVFDTPDKVAKLLQFDWKWYNANEDQIVNRFNKVMQG
jgi:putative spermidine/putrescine transport system substrate-binding protein